MNEHPFVNRDLTMVLVVGIGLILILTGLFCLNKELVMGLIITLVGGVVMILPFQVSAKRQRQEQERESELVTRGVAQNVPSYVSVGSFFQHGSENEGMERELEYVREHADQFR